MKIVDLADDIFRELDSPTDLGIPQITYWLRNNVGNLNNYIATVIIFDETAHEFMPELTVEQANIFKYMYLVKYAARQMNNSLGASGVDWSELSEGDSTIRRVSRNEVAKNYKQLRDAYNVDLNRLIFLYKQNINVPAVYKASFIGLSYESCL